MMLSDMMRRKLDLTVKTSESEDRALANELDRFFIEVNCDEEEDAFGLIPDEADNMGMYLTFDKQGRKYENYLYKLDRVIFYIRLACMFEKALYQIEPPTWTVRLLVDRKLT